MANIDIKNAFDPSTVDIYNYFQKRGVGFYIPHYQREYSWGTENIEQLLLDVEIGVEELISDSDEFRFLGTVITVKELNNNNIKPIEENAVPSTIQNVIDGQQRLSTLAIFSAILYDHVDKLRNKVSIKSDYYVQLIEACDWWKDKLIDVFSFELRRGVSRKPKIIRASDDQWTVNGDVNTHYKSDISNFIARFIEYIEDVDIKNRPIANGELLPSNIYKIEKWISKKVLLAHSDSNIEYSRAIDLIQSIPEENLWAYSHPELKNEIIKNELDPKSDSYIASQLIQLFAACHYLLDRCCLTVIVPGKTEWAFDLFQSLNATGTPLTAIETFLPTVVNVTKENENEFKGTDSERNFEIIKDCLSGKSAGEKSKKTNDFLTSIRICVDGEKLAGQFSHQRIWLDELYTKKLKNYSEQKELISLFGHYAFFINEIWHYEVKNNQPIQRLVNGDRDLISLLIRYLISVNHKMSITILALSFRKILENKPNAEVEFADTVRLIAIFYTYWRSTESNAGLDNVYRSFFKGGVGQKSHNWLVEKELNFEELKIYLQTTLRDKCKVFDKESWIKNAENKLRYDESGNQLCRFVLLTCADDTIVDPHNPGLIQIGRPNTFKYLTLEKWESKDLESVEHVAPQDNKSSWDNDLYEENEKSYQKIGNLTLLPKYVNSSAGNRPWMEKYLYFKYISEIDPNNIKLLKAEASSRKLNLSNDTTNLLTKVNFNNHVKSIIEVGIDGAWNNALVKQRSRNIVEIFWDKTSDWIF